ncbi:hypothetical protein RIVM261_015370 [Rivularia sp. IAM M-261]|nr:hypothetical protein RIVM261_015370 [Rivularia sp. IAM M-261]
MRRHQQQLQMNGGIRLRRIVATFLVGLVGITLNRPIPASAQTENKVPRPEINNQATFTYTDANSQFKYQGVSSVLDATPKSLVDPLGRILGCGGNILTDYRGFSVAVYEPNPNDPTGTELGRLLDLTPTEVPDIEGNGVFGGLEPNGENSNPFFLTNTDGGFYNFLLDPNKGQTNPGRTYILVVNAPSNSIYTQRRVKLEIMQPTGSIQNNIVRYVATSIDGQPISVRGGTQVSQNVVFVPDAEKVGLDLLAFQFDLGLCQSEQVKIIKTADRATAEPGDTVIYRLSLRNLSDANLDNIVVSDTLPLGFKFLPNSIRAEIDGQVISVTAAHDGNTVVFRTDAVMGREKVLNIAYGAQLTADAVRGNGRNSAIVNAQRADNDFAIKDGPATHQLKIRPGITSDCGTIIGRVFEDKNFDGEQQQDEPGISNAVIILQDGNRVNTDKNGLFSVANSLPGKHTGVLDLTSVPGYKLAPNYKFKERNSQSRLVNLAPGGMARMNFAVTSITEEVKK